MRDELEDLPPIPVALADLRAMAGRSSRADEASSPGQERWKGWMEKGNAGSCFMALRFLMTPWRGRKRLFTPSNIRYKGLLEAGNSRSATPLSIFNNDGGRGLISKTYELGYVNYLLYI